jgi:hypothetical protein
MTKPKAAGATKKSGPGEVPSVVAMNAASQAALRKAVRGPDRMAKLEAMKALQQDLHSRLDHYRVAGYRDTQANSAAEELNRLINEFFEKAAHILSPEEFEKAFAFEAGESITLVDPEIMAGIEQKR